jgi:hypothetical protein
MNRSVFSLVCLTLFLVGATSNTDAAITVFDSFGPGNGGNDFDPSSADTVGNNLGGETLLDGHTFTPATTGTLAQITIAFEFFQGVNAGTVSLRADAAGAPGAVLESWSVSNLPPFNTVFHTPLTLNDATNVSLTAGTPYWVVVSTTSASTLDWNLTKPITLGIRATSINDGASWRVHSDFQGAFRVTENESASVVPEPASITLWSLIALGSAVSAWRRRKLA